MKKKLFYFLLIVILVAFYFFEKNIMTKNDLQLEMSEGYTSFIAVTIMLVSSIIGILSSHHPALNDILSLRLKRLVVLMFILTLFMSLFYPLGSRYLLGAIILPLFLYNFMTLTPKDSKSRNIVVWMFSVVYVLLGYVFIHNSFFSESFFSVENVSNASYYCLYLLPFMLCHKKRLLRIVFIIISLIIVMLSIKRGGFVALLTSVLVYYLILQFGIKGKKFKIWGVAVIAIIGITISYLVLYVNGTVLEGKLFDRMSAIEESGGAGRLDLYVKYLKFIGNSSPITWLFGNGWQGSIRASGFGLTCHNDFLESMVDYGIGGFVLYIMLHVAIIKHCLKMVRIKHEYAPAMGASVVLFFLNSMVSHILMYPWYFMSFVFFWGFMVSSTKEAIVPADQLYSRRLNN